MLKHTISILYYQSVLKAVFGSYKTVAAFSIVIVFFFCLCCYQKSSRKLCRKWLVVGREGGY